MNVSEAFNLAVAHHQQGRVPEAERLYGEILAWQPEHAGALHLLGIIRWGQNRRAEGEGMIRRAIALAPGEMGYQINLARLLFQAGDLAGALAMQRSIAGAAPDNAVAQFELGLTLQRAGNLEEAEAHYRQALARNPAYAEVHNAMGVLLKDRKHHEQAITCFREALRLRPQMFEAMGNLGDTLSALGRHEEAVPFYDAALRLQPNHAELLAGLAAAYAAARLGDAAVQVYARLIQLKPTMAEAYNNLGNVLRLLGRMDEAANMYRTALSYRGDLAEAHHNLGLIHLTCAERDAALSAFRRSVELQPLEHRPHSSLLYAMHFHPAATSASLGEAHREWNVRHAAQLRPASPPRLEPRGDGRKLRIGYVSGDFRNHAVGRFMLPLLRHHDRSRFEVYCYADIAPRDEDAITAKSRAAAEHWRSIHGLSDEAAAAAIRADAIDILVDLTMHLENSRLLIFARKPAPIQVTYLAHCSTTGLEAIDYRLTDRWIDPPDAIRHYSEKSAYVNTYWCYDAPDAGAVSRPPFPKTGSVTFACMNNFMKASPAALEAWARILKNVPGSRLLLHAHAGSHQERTRKLFAERGVEPGRVEFAGHVATADYFRQYDRIDIALDPFPYAGGTTTCDALWMGVPVITLAGEMGIGRGGVSILQQMGLAELIAENVEEYVGLATTLGQDPSRLGQLRATLRERMQKSPLMDAEAFARSVEAAYDEMVRQVDGGC